MSGKFTLLVILRAFSISLLLVLLENSGYSQELWKGSEFIESPDGIYETRFSLVESDLTPIAQELQPSRRKYKIIEDSAVIEMSYVVYEAAAIGERPFGRIRYIINLNQMGDFLDCRFENFTFKKIERNPRYAKLEEVRGRPVEISAAKKSLSKDQWKIVRWKTELVMERNLASLSSFNLQVSGSQ